MSSTQPISSGETSLTTLLTTLNPILTPSPTFVFATISSTSPLDADVTARSIMVLQEPHRKSQTLILPLEDAQQIASERDDFTYEFECKRIILDVHSSLSAIGYMAVLSKALAEKEIGCNPISGYYSDHLFVPAERADEAMVTLRGVKEKAQADLQSSSTQ